jgi:hypothetical protein
MQKWIIKFKTRSLFMMGKKKLIYLPQIQPTDETTAQSRQKLKPICDLSIEHLPNPVTLVMKEVEQEDEATIMLRMKSLNLVRIEGPIDDCPSAGSPIENRSSPGLMTCSGASDDTSNFPVPGAH